jgi:hypothetical protein
MRRAMRTMSALLQTRFSPAHPASTGLGKRQTREALCVAPKLTIRSAGKNFVAHAPSNVKDAAAGKSFIFIAIVVPNAMGTLLRAVSALLRTRFSAAAPASSGARTRHKRQARCLAPNLMQADSRLGRL